MIAITSTKSNGPRFERLNMSMSNRIELRSYVRFQLAQLSVKNSAHAFEHLAFELARLRVASNLLPATGPVQAGGDQGRDFESYRTYLGISPLKDSSFTAPVGSNVIAGACSLEKKIFSKIKRDLKIIFGSGEKPTHIVYFCEPDVPVATRHKLKTYCKEQYKASLDIFDGQAIADMLADREALWIAEQYLEIPADTWPVSTLDDQYLAARERWLKNDVPLQNYADFLEIKQSLRTATFDADAKPDVSGWIKAMGRFLDDGVPERLKQKARYEMAVGELRGRGSLDPALPLIAALFDKLSAESPPTELLDAAVLTVYCWGAPAHGQWSIDRKTTGARLQKLDELLETAYRVHTSNGDRCTIREAQAMVGFIPRHDHESPEQVMRRFFDLWEDVIRHVKKTPLFPVMHIADILEVLTSLTDPDGRLRALTDDVDTLVAERAGKGAAAERARRRAIAHLDAGRHVAAIDELQRTKAGWFSGEHIDGSILAMLVISEAYESLRLHFASRYYAAGTLFTALNQGDERLTRRIAQAVFRLATTFFAAGEGLTFLHSFGAALTVHAGLAHDAEDWTKYPQVQRGIVHAAIFRGVSRRIAPNLLPLIDAAIERWPFDTKERGAFLELSEGEPWSSMPISEIESKIVRDLGHPPFADIGAQRTAAWSAFGVTWTVHGTADEATWMAALEVAVTLQIVQVDFADADLLIVPSHTVIHVELHDIDRPKFQQLPDNGCLAWRIAMPHSPQAGSDPRNSDLARLVMTILGQATALPLERFEVLTIERLERGLPIRLLSVRPVRELMKFALPERSDLAASSAVSRPQPQSSMVPVESDELCWRTGAGPGYDPKLAEKYLRRRYEVTAKALRLTLPRLLSDRRCRDLIGDLRSRGLLNWQILTALSAIVSQWQVERLSSRRLPPDELGPMVMKRLLREEADDDPTFDLSHLTGELLDMQLNALTVAAFKTWDLGSYRQTPDFNAMKRLLDERYRHSADDVPHDDPFPGLQQGRAN